MAVPDSGAAILFPANALPACPGSKAQDAGLHAEQFKL